MNVTGERDAANAKRGATVRAAEWIGPGELRLVELEAPVAAKGQAVVEVESCGICGSDLHSYRNGFAARPGQVLGHEFSGTVVDAPGVAGVTPGDRVAVRPLIPCGRCAGCRRGQPQLCEAREPGSIGYGSPGAFAEQVLVPRAIVGETIFPLPPEVHGPAGALVEPLSVALHAVRRAAVEAGGVALVLGAGTIGLAVTRLLGLHGAGKVVVADLSALRRARALELGADVVIDPVSEDMTEVMRSITGPGGSGLGARADVVVDCAGAPAALAHALKSVRQGGVLVLAAFYGGEVPIRLDRVIDKELDVRGSFAYRDEFGAIVRLLASGELDAERFISHTFGLDDIDEAFQVQMDTARSLKVLVRP